MRTHHAPLRQNAEERRKLGHTCFLTAAMAHGQDYGGKENRWQRSPRSQRRRQQKSVFYITTGEDLEGIITELKRVLQVKSSRASPNSTRASTSAPPTLFCRSSSEGIDQLKGVLQVKISRASSPSSRRVSSARPSARRTPTPRPRLFWRSRGRWASTPN
jgi:hypothetical protein